MNTVYMLDTNMVSYIAKGQSKAARTRMLNLEEDEVACLSVMGLAQETVVAADGQLFRVDTFDRLSDGAFTKLFCQAVAGVYGIATAAAAWWKGDALALANGDNVTSWPDSGPGGFTLTPGTAPTFNTTNFPAGAVKFTAASAQHLQNAAYNALNAVAGFTWFVVYRHASVQDAILMMPVNEAGTLQNPGHNPYAYASPGNSGLFSVAQGDAGVKHIHEVVFDGSQTGNAARLVVLAEGVAQTLSFSGTIPAVTTSASGITVGQTGSGVIPYDGDIAEILAFPVTLNSTDRSTVRHALGTKWSITVS